MAIRFRALSRRSSQTNHTMIARVMAKATPSPAPTPAIVLVETPLLLDVDDVEWGELVELVAVGLVVDVALEDILVLEELELEVELELAVPEPETAELEPDIGVNQV